MLAAIWVKLGSESIFYWVSEEGAGQGQGARFRAIEEVILFPFDIPKTKNYPFNLLLIVASISSIAAFIFSSI